VAGLSVAGAVFFVWRWFSSRVPKRTDIERLDWSEFQPLLCQFLERQGYILVESGNRPGIVDLVVRKDRQTFVVHAKSWNAGKLDLGVVSKLYDAMLTRGVNSGIVVSGSKFGRGAQAFARETQIQLIDGTLLRLWFKRHLHSQARMEAEQAKLTTAQPADPEPMETRMLPEFFSPVSAYVAPMTPSCPLCSAPMKERKARKGRHAGTKFWGCTRSPQCKGIKRWGEA
jgi:restriction system protein